MRKRRCMSRPHALERKLKTTTNVGEHVTCHANARAARVTARPQPPCKRWRCQMLRLVPSSWPTNHDTVLSRVKRATMRRVRALEGAFARRKNAHSYTTPLADWMGRWGSEPRQHAGMQARFYCASNRMHPTDELTWGAGCCVSHLHRASWSCGWLCEGKVRTPTGRIAGPPMTSRHLLGAGTSNRHPSSVVVPMQPS
jgi:hypothetical protein